MSEPTTAEEIARYVVARAVWAPSVHNTQPWRFTADGGPRISLHADVGRRLAVADPDGREMMISCGAALFTVRLALRALGYIPETTVLPDPAQPTLVAQVSWRERAAADEFERRLSGHILTRRTHRGAFDPEPLPPDTLAALRAAAEREGAALRIVADDGRRAALAVAAQLVLGGLHGGRERGPAAIVRHDAQRRSLPCGGRAQRGEHVRRQRLGIKRAAMGPPGENVVI